MTAMRHLKKGLKKLSLVTGLSLAFIAGVAAFFAMLLVELGDGDGPF